MPNTELPTVIAHLIEAHAQLQNARRLWHLRERSRPRPDDLFDKCELTLSTLLASVAGPEFADTLAQAREQ